MRLALASVAAVALAAVLAPVTAASATDLGARPGATCDWPVYGGAPTRDFASSCAAAATTTTAHTLAPRWFVHMPDVVTAAPSVVAGTAYVGDWSGNFVALDAATGAQRWSTVLGNRRADAAADHHQDDYGEITSSAAVSDVAGRRVAFVGAGGSMYALDTAATDDAHRVLWRFDVDPAHPTGLGEIESSPVVWRSPAGPVVIFGADANQSSGFAGEGLWAVEARTGHLLWHFNPEVAAGKALYGCGNIWSSPALSLDPTNPDPSRRVLAIAGLADCPASAASPCPADGSDAHCPPGQSYDSSQRWTRYSEAIIAVDARSGSPVWSFQPHPQPNGNDDDFGASAQLFRLGGRPVVGEGSKDGSYYVVDRTSGAPVWAAPEQGNGNVQPGFAIGGFLGTPAVDTTAGSPLVAGGSAIDTPVSDSGGGVPSPQPTPLDGATPMRAFSGVDGAKRWQSVQGPMYGPSTTANGVLYAGALDGLLRAYDVSTGQLLAAVPLSGPISSGAAVAGNMVVIGAGTDSSDVEFKTCSRVPAQVQGVCHSAPLDPTLNPLSNVNGIWGLSAL